MLAWILKILSGGILDKLLGYLRASQDAGTEREKLKTQVVIKGIEAEMAARQNAREVRLATAGFWEMRLLTAAIALPFVLHLNLVGLDTCFQLGWGIPKFPPPFDAWEGTILLSFFGVYAGLGAVQTMAAVVARKLK